MFQIYQTVYKKVHNSQMSFDEAIRYIKGQDRRDIEIIQKLRSLTRDNPEFDRLKKTFPLIMWNCLTNGSRNVDNVNTFTGYIYFDIDGCESHQFNKDYIAASWKSISGTGYGILVKVKGLTRANFKATYKAIGNTLGLNYDENATDIVRLNYLSYDPEIVVNTEAHIHPAVEYENIDFLPTSDDKMEDSSNSIDVSVSGQKIRYNDLKDQTRNIDITYDSQGLYAHPNKIPYTEVWVPKNIKVGERNRKLTSIAIKLVTLNDQMSAETLLRHLISYNKNSCVEPLEVKEIKQICSNVYKNKSKYELIPNATRRFFFKEKMDVDEKRSKVISYLNKEKTTKGDVIIREAFLDLIKKEQSFGMIDLMKETGMVRNTINKRLPQLLSEFPEEFKKWFILKEKMRNKLGITEGD